MSCGAAPALARYLWRVAGGELLSVNMERCATKRAQRRQKVCATPVCASLALGLASVGVAFMCQWGSGYGGVDGAEVVRAPMMQGCQCRAARCSLSVSVGHGARWSRQCFSASINSVFHCPPPLRLASRPRCASLVHVTFYAACHSRNDERRGERYDRSPCPAPRTRMV